MGNFKIGYSAANDNKIVDYTLAASNKKPG